MKQASAKAAKAPKLIARYQAALDCLLEVCTISAPARTGLGWGATVGTLTAWRDEMKRRGILNEDRLHRDFYDIRMSLQAKKVVTVDSEHVWPNAR